ARALCRALRLACPRPPIAHRLPPGSVFHAVFLHLKYRQLRGRAPSEGVGGARPMVPQESGEAGSAGAVAWRAMVAGVTGRTFQQPGAVILDRRIRRRTPTVARKLTQVER